MKSFSFKILMVISSVSLTACLEQVGTIETTAASTSNNTDFSVITPSQDTNTSSSSSGTTNSDTPGVVAPTPTPVADPNDPWASARGIILNNDITPTQNLRIPVTFDPPFFAGYYTLSNDRTCSSTTWINYLKQLEVGASASGWQTWSVKFKDYDNTESPCYSASILMDNVGPSILFSKYPSASVEEGSLVELVVSITDELTHVKSATCTILNSSKPCYEGQNTLQIQNIAAGNYVLQVSAEDTLGNKSFKEIGFTVVSSYKSIVQKVAVTENNKVDILFVMDNSGSMQYEQQSMASRVKNFIDVVNGLDWQMAVTTTDPTSTTWGDGRLVPFKNLTDTYVLNSSMNQATSKSSLSATLQRSEVGSGVEQGILGTYRAIERSIVETNTKKQWIRSGAQLAVVLISDEDESANGTKNDPQNLINLVHQQFGGQKAFTFHSIITRPGDTACLTTNGATAGFRYQTMSQLTGGLIGDVCATDYTEQVKGIADGVRQTLKTITLSCAPVVNASKQVIVKKDGVVYTGANTLNGLNLVFTDSLPAGQYEVNYTCLK